MERRIDLFNIFNTEEKIETIYIYSAKQTIVDPYEKNKELTLLHPIAIKGLIRQVSAEALHWKYFGQIPVKSIEVIIEKRHKKLLIEASQIKYKDKYYTCYKNDSKGFVILERSDYILAVLAEKND